VLLVVLVAIAVSGCRCNAMWATRNPRLGLEVLKGQSGYEVTFSNCTNDARIEIYYVKVMPSVDLKLADATPPICFIEIDSSSPKQEPIVERWIYGAVPPGYRETKRCEPLVPGSEYRISSWHQGSGRFAVERDGGIKMLEGGCPE
jgi:hypothetical protein